MTPVFPWELPESLRGAKVRHVPWSGNHNLEGCPLYWGWTVRLDRHTTPTEKWWLKKHGFHFRGGEWGRRDDEPVGYGKSIRGTRDE